MKEELSIDQILSSIKKVIASRGTRSNAVENGSNVDEGISCQLKLEQNNLKKPEKPSSNEKEYVYELKECIAEAICDKSAITGRESVYNLSAFEDIGEINAKILNELADIKAQLANNWVGLENWLNNNIPQIVSGVLKKEMKKLNVKNNPPNL